MKPTTLLTKRLILRRAVQNDARSLFNNYTKDPECARFLTRPAHKKVEETSLMLEKLCDVPWEKECDMFAWIISLQESNEPIGVFLIISEGHKAQIHFGIGREFWKQGLVTECANVVIEWLMKQPQLQRIWTVCDLLNYGSIKILEKLGFQREGILQKWLILPAFGDQARDCYMYALTKNSN